MINLDTFDPTTSGTAAAYRANRLEAALKELLEALAGQGNQKTAVDWAKRVLVGG